MMIKQEKKRGFTLIEMMVAVSIFVIVAFIVVSTLLTLSYSYRKAQKMRLLMDNFNFSLQSMSLNIREGINYDNLYCSTDKNCIQFLPIDSWLDPTKVNDTICYQKLDAGIKKCTTCPCNASDLDVVSSEIVVNKLKFNIEGPDGKLKKVQIIIDGTAGTVPKEKTSFFIQNTVSQRNSDQ